MASMDLIREAAIYLEYFLKGMSECNVIGSYTIQFLEMRSFSVRVQESLATHLVQLITNLRGLLFKFDTSYLPVTEVGIQTDTASVCSICSCHSSLEGSFRSVPLQEQHKEKLEDATSSEKTFESHDLAQLFTSTPLVQLKQELPCVADSLTPGTSQAHQMDVSGSHIDFKELGPKDGMKLREADLNTVPQVEKCILTPALQSALDDHMELDLDSSSSHLEDTDQGGILLDPLEQSNTGRSDELMYSVYTMNSCGSLQLVSRVLSKSAGKDGADKPVERALIEIKEEETKLQDTLETVTFHSDDSQIQQTSLSQEEMIIAPDIPGIEGKQSRKQSNKGSKVKMQQSRTFLQGTNGGTILTDIVKLGPEDLGSGTWCGICEKEFPSAGSLKVHLSRIHSQVKWCHTCTMTIRSEEEMCDHVREFHGDLPFICSVCGQSLKNNSAFQRHLDIHKGLRGSACEICGQTFSRTEYYHEHKRIHTGEKPYECETCKKTFSRVSNLYTHKRIHNAEAPRHTCNVCSKSFNRADKLKDHMIRHLQIKRYACRLCPKAYNEKRDLTKHLEKVHSNNSSVHTGNQVSLGNDCKNFDCLHFPSQ